MLHLFQASVTGFLLALAFPTSERRFCLLPPLQEEEPGKHLDGGHEQRLRARAQGPLQGCQDRLHRARRARQVEVHRLSRPAAARGRVVGHRRGRGGGSGGLAAAAASAAATPTAGRPKAFRCHRRPAAIAASSVNLVLFQSATKSSATSAEAAARSIAAATAQADRSCRAASAATPASDDESAVAATSGLSAASECLAACSRGGQRAPLSGCDSDCTPSSGPTSYHAGRSSDAISADGELRAI